jgi:hypothetical protein
MTTTYCSLCQKVFNLLVLVASLSLLFPFLKFWLHVKILNKNLTLLSISCQLLLKTSSPANLPNPILYLFLLLKQLCICHYRLCFIFKEFYVTRIIHTVHTIFSWVFQSVLFWDSPILIDGSTVHSFLLLSIGSLYVYSMISLSFTYW